MLEYKPQAEKNAYEKALQAFAQTRLGGVLFITVFPEIDRRLLPLTRGRISTGFFGVVGISTMHGLMEMSAEEAQTKRFLADSCERVIGLFDSGKVGGFGLHSFAAVKDITAMYTDDKVPATLATEWETLGVPVHLIPSDHPPRPIRDPRLPRKVAPPARKSVTGPGSR